MRSLEQIAGAEQPDQADHNQVYRDNEIQQARHDQDQNPGDQCDQRGKAQVDIHGVFTFLVFGRIRFYRYVYSSSCVTACGTSWRQFIAGVLPARDRQENHDKSAAKNKSDTNPSDVRAWHSRLLEENLLVVG